MLTRKQAIEFLTNHPVKYARMLGFTKLTSLHDEWIKDMLKGKKDETLMAHRASYKTTCVSVALALIIILLPTKRTMFMRKTDADIKEVVKQVQKILLDPHTQYFVQCIYGINLLLTTQTTSEINTNLVSDAKGVSQLLGIGTGGSLTGKHFDYIFTDDIININDRVSKAERERTKLVYQELQNIKNRDGRIFNTLTPWHREDASTLMPEPKKYTCYETGLISKEQLVEIKKSMLPSLFAANYELRHIASEDIIFSNPKTGADISLVEQGSCHIDAAYGGEDYTAFTACRKIEGIYYVFGKLWRKHVDDVEDEIISLRKSLNCGKIAVEDNGDKGYLAKELRKKGERVEVYHESMNKFLKITSYLKSEWENVVFVVGTDKEYIDQICDYNENAEHDDAPDSLSSMIRKMWNKRDSVSTYTPIMMRR